MGLVTVSVGRIGPHGEDHTRQVAFCGEKLGECVDKGQGWRRTERLYRAADERLIVAWEFCSAWQGDSDHAGLELVSKADLMPGGKYEWLGKRSGFDRTLSLDDALKLQEKDGGSKDGQR